MNCYELLFNEYAKKWNVDFDTARIIFLIIDGRKSYVKVSRSLNELGFKTSPRQLRYFYRKVVLTQRYGVPDKIGSENYRRVVIRKL